MTRKLFRLCVLAFLQITARAEPGVEAASIKLDADAEITAAWINERPATLGEHSRDWTHPDEYDPTGNLSCIAVSAESGKGLGRTGFIGMVVLKDGRQVPTDGTWRVWHGDGEPPADVKGRPWTAPDYDDHAWPFATEIGIYGCGPWGASGKKLPDGSTASPELDAAMRWTSPATGNSKESPTLNLPQGATLPAGTDISSFLRPVAKKGVPPWNATWIWAGPPLGGAQKAFFRKVFTGGAGIAPGKPQSPYLVSVTPKSFTLAWEPSFSAQGPVTYELAWNGQVMLKTSGTSGIVDGITINPVPQNYAWVRAVAPDGSSSPPSACVLIYTPSHETPEAPAHLRVTGRNPNGVSLAWDPAKDGGKLSGYKALVNKIMCVVPPGVCSLSVNFSKFIQPGSPLTVELYAEDISGNSGPVAKLDDWTSATTPVDISAPAHLRLDSGRLFWTAVPAATAYRLLRDGIAVPGHFAGTDAALPAGGKNGFVQVMAMDDQGNASPLSAPLVIGNPSRPQAPVVSDGGHSGETVVLRWSRPAGGTCTGYRVEREEGKAWTPIAQISDPWQNEYIAGKVESYLTGNNDSLPAPDKSSGGALEPGHAYRFRVVAIGADKSEVPGNPLEVTTVAPPSAKPVLRFAVILATDGRYDFLEKSLTDADEARCAFALIKGQIVPQLSSDPKQWDSMMEVVRRHRATPVLALIASKDGWSEISDFSAPVSLEEDMRLIGRYDMAPWRTGQPLDQLHTELGGALRMAGVLENPLGNPGFLPDLERWLQDAEADSSCRWFFTSGVSTESAPKGVPRVMLELYRPGIDFMRMINGDRGHELSLDAGSAVACACPQRNRVGAHYLVTVEEKRIVFESRQYDKKAQAFITDGLQEIAYDRGTNRISAANLRIPYPFGIVTGLPQRADTTPPWTQNRILKCAPGGQVEVKLLGHSSRDTALTFSVSRPPAHGTLTGTGDTLVYHAAPGFTGEDFFLYRADDGGPWPGNTAWARITVGAGK